MTIAELLVQTLATIGTADANRSASVKDLVAEARELVAAIYGEPCASIGGTWTNPRPGNICPDCHWPRSQHGAKP